MGGQLSGLNLTLLYKAVTRFKGRLGGNFPVSSVCIYFKSGLFLNLCLGWCSHISYYVIIEATKIERPCLPGRLALCNED